MSTREKERGERKLRASLHPLAFLSFLVTTVQLVHRQYTRRRESEPLSEQCPTIFGHGWGERGEMVGQLEPIETGQSNSSPFETGSPGYIVA